MTEDLRQSRRSRSCQTQANLGHIVQWAQVRNCELAERCDRIGGENLANTVKFENAESVGVHRFRAEAPSGRHRLTHVVDHFVVLGELSCGFLRVHEITVHRHFKNATRALDELGLDAEFLFQSGGQTGRLRVVVSHHAVFDRNFWKILGHERHSSTNCCLG